MGTLRFLLALCVVVTHGPGETLFGIPLLSGITAVQGFYVISGFLITMILNERKAYQSLRNFYLSRYLRLWPPYIVIALTSLWFFKWDMQFHVLGKMGVAAIGLTWFSNLSLFFQDWFLFLRVDHGQLSLTAHFAAAPQPWIVDFLLAPQCWTLGVEMTFYTLAPFFCRSWRRTLVLFGIGLATRIAIGFWQAPEQDPWQYRFAPAEMMLFAAGGLSYFSWRLYKIWLPARALQILGALAVLVVSVIVLCNKWATPLIQAQFGWWWQSIYLTNGPIIAGIAIFCPFLFDFSQRYRLDDLLGELSYPMYVSHLMVLDFITQRIPPGWNAGNLFYVLCVIAVSILLFKGVVVPVDRIRHRFGARVPVGEARLPLREAPEPTSLMIRQSGEVS